MTVKLLVVLGLVTFLTLLHQARVSPLEKKIATLHEQITGLADLQARYNHLLKEKRAEADELDHLRKSYQELMRLRGEVAFLNNQLARLKNTSAATNTGSLIELDTAAHLPITEPPEHQTEALSTYVFNTGKLLGLLSRIQASFQGAAFPTNFDQIHHLLPQHLKGKQALDRFEFVDNGRPLTTRDPGFILLRERVPRQLPNGNWARIYHVTDGTTVEKTSPTPDFEQYERQFRPE